MSTRTVWHDIGIRSGEFSGVDPCTFLNTGARFFIKLRQLIRRALLPGYIPNEKEAEFSFTGRGKWKEYLDWNSDECRRRFYYIDAPMGVPIPREVWESSGTGWGPEIISPALETVLKEPPVTVENLPKGHLYAGELEWPKQCLKLIQAMRFCIIPLEITYQGSDNLWYEWFGGTGCINTSSFKWVNMKQLIIRIPAVWNTPGSVFRIGVYASNQTPEYQAPIEGCFWKKTKEYRISIVQNCFASSELRIFGVADLSTCTGFEQYFDTESEQ